MNPFLATADRLMDATIAPGFTSVGYRIRSRSWEDAPDLSGRHILVTGASSGLGVGTCELLADAGAHAHMLVRNLEKGESVRATLADRSDPSLLTLWRCDVSDQAS